MWAYMGYVTLDFNSNTWAYTDQPIAGSCIMLFLDIFLSCVGIEVAPNENL